MGMGDHYLEHYDRPVINAAGETIPAYAVMQVSGWANDNKGKDVFQVSKPTGSGKVYLINGPFAIPSGKMGWGSQWSGVFALYDPSITPVNGMELGPISGTWYLGVSGGGFAVVGDVTAGRVRVAFVAESAGVAAVLLCTANADAGPDDLITCTVVDVIEGTPPAPQFEAINGYHRPVKAGDYLLVHQDEHEPLRMTAFVRPPLPGARTGLVAAMCTADVPGMTAYDGVAYTQTPGILTADLTATVPFGGVVILQWDTANNPVASNRVPEMEPHPASDPADPNPPMVVRRRPAYNDSKSVIRCSAGEPLIFEGYIEQVGTPSASERAALYERFIITNVMDMRGFENFDATKHLIPGFFAEADGKAKLYTIREWLKKLEEYVAGNNQSIGHDADEEPEWQDDTDQCPEE